MIASCLVIVAEAGGALADEPAPAAPADPPAVHIGGQAFETWTGVDATRTSASIWTGLTWAPSGLAGLANASLGSGNVQEPGLRLRVVSGAGRYSYDGWRLVRGLPAPAHFNGMAVFLDGLVGYHLQLGPLTLKPFAGVGIVQHVVTPLDPVSAITGRKLGVKLALDTWLRLGTAAWLNVDGSWTAVHETASMRARLGLRVWQDLSLGLEAATLSDVNQETRRAGLFLRYAWERGEISVAGGLSGQTADGMLKNPQPYAGASLLTRF